jgi:hypothetical protein
VHPLHKPVSFMFATLNGLLPCQDFVLSSVTTEVWPCHIMRLCWCDSRNGGPLCYRFGTGIWHVYESTPFWPLSPLTDTRVVALVLRVKVLRSTHNLGPPARGLSPSPDESGMGTGMGIGGSRPGAQAQCCQPGAPCMDPCQPAHALQWPAPT